MASSIATNAATSARGHACDRDRARPRAREQHRKDGEADGKHDRTAAVRTETAARHEQEGDRRDEREAGAPKRRARSAAPASAGTRTFRAGSRSRRSARSGSGRTVTARHSARRRRARRGTRRGLPPERLHGEAGAQDKGEERSGDGHGGRDDDEHDPRLRDTEHAENEVGSQSRREADESRRGHAKASTRMITAARSVAGSARRCSRRCAGRARAARLPRRLLPPT